VRRPGGDPDRIYVLGHSLGGTVAACVAAAEPTTAGPILVAAGAQPAQLPPRSQPILSVQGADNHRLFRGAGPSTPAVYEKADHFDPNVLTDTADWLHTQEQPHGYPQHHGGAPKAHPTQSKEPT
jgi:pimeloyl-ACP methyl ester carboxylesterase